MLKKFKKVLDLKSIQRRFFSRIQLSKGKINLNTEHKLTSSHKVNNTSNDNNSKEILNKPLEHKYLNQILAEHKFDKNEQFQQILKKIEIEHTDIYKNPLNFKFSVLVCQLLSPNSSHELLSAYPSAFDHLNIFGENLNSIFKNNQRELIRYNLFYFLIINQGDFSDHIYSLRRIFEEGKNYNALNLLNDLLKTEVFIPKSASNDIELDELESRVTTFPESDAIETRYSMNENESESRLKQERNYQIAKSLMYKLKIKAAENKLSLSDLQHINFYMNNIIEYNKTSQSISNEITKLIEEYSNLNNFYKDLLNSNKNNNLKEKFDVYQNPAILFNPIYTGEFNIVEQFKKYNRSVGLEKTIQLLNNYLDQLNNFERVSFTELLNLETVLYPIRFKSINDVFVHSNLIEHNLSNLKNIEFELKFTPLEKVYTDQIPQKRIKVQNNKKIFENLITETSNASTVPETIVKTEVQIKEKEEKKPIISKAEPIQSFDEEEKPTQKILKPIGMKKNEKNKKKPEEKKKLSKEPAKVITKEPLKENLKEPISMKQEKVNRKDNSTTKQETEFQKEKTKFESLSLKKEETVKAEKQDKNKEKSKEQPKRPIRQETEKVHKVEEKEPLKILEVQEPVTNHEQKDFVKVDEPKIELKTEKKETEPQSQPEPEQVTQKPEQESEVKEDEDIFGVNLKKLQSNTKTKGAKRYDFSDAIPKTNFFKNKRSKFSETFYPENEAKSDSFSKYIEKAENITKEPPKTEKPVEQVEITFPYEIKSSSKKALFLNFPYNDLSNLKPSSIILNENFWQSNVRSNPNNSLSYLNDLVSVLKRNDFNKDLILNVLATAYFRNKNLGNKEDFNEIIISDLFYKIHENINYSLENFGYYILLSVGRSLQDKALIKITIDHINNHNETLNQNVITLLLNICNEFYLPISCHTTIDKQIVVHNNKLSKNNFYDYVKLLSQFREYTDYLRNLTLNSKEQMNIFPTMQYFSFVLLNYIRMNNFDAFEEMFKLSIEKIKECYQPTEVENVLINGQLHLIEKIQDYLKVNENDKEVQSNKVYIVDILEDLIQNFSKDNKNIYENPKYINLAMKHSIHGKYDEKLFSKLLNYGVMSKKQVLNFESYELILRFLKDKNIRAFDKSVLVTLENFIKSLKNIKFEKSEEVYLFLTSDNLETLYSLSRSLKLLPHLLEFIKKNVTNEVFEDLNEEDVRRLKAYVFNIIPNKYDAEQFYLSLDYFE